MYWPKLFSVVTLSDILLFPWFGWKVVEWVFCLVLLLFYTADIMLTGKLFWYFSSSFLVQGEKWKEKKRKEEDIYINNYNNYNYDCNKQKPRTINVGVQCLVSAIWTNLPVARNLHSNHHPGNVETNINYIEIVRNYVFLTVLSCLTHSHNDASLTTQAQRIANERHCLRILVAGFSSNEPRFSAVTSVSNCCSRRFWRTLPFAAGRKTLPSR